MTFVFCPKDETKTKSSFTMAPKLYKMDLSPPARAVLLTASALGVHLDHVEINLTERDQLKPEFVKLNPQHTIPTLEDEGKVIWDSHAINAYLVTKYGKNDSLYPKDLYKRAVIDQRLHFDSGVMFSLIRQIVRPMKYKGVKTISQDLIDEVNISYEFLNKFLEGNNWAAGNDVTVADFSLLSTATSLDVVVPINASKYPNIIAWVKRAQKLPYYSINQKGVRDFKDLMQKLQS